MSNPTETIPSPARATEDEVLAVHDLHVDYHTLDGIYHAIRGVSITLRRGEKIGIVGESGCGKSTLALALMGLLEPPAVIDSGEVVLQGRSVLGLSETELDRLRGKEIAIIFQDPMTALDPVKRVGDQIAEALLRHAPEMRRSAARRSAIELLLEVEVPDPERRAEDYPHQFSGGMRQRALIAMALANEPAVLIADEPTTALDVTTQAQVLDLLDRLVTERGAAAILITHNLGIVAEFCHAVHVMYAGRVVETAPTINLFRSQLHPYTEGLLRSVPRPQMRGGELASIPGSPPSLAAVPAGCPFHPRCPLAADICMTDLPPVKIFASAAGEWSAECHFAGERQAAFSEVTP